MGKNSDKISDKNARADKGKPFDIRTDDLPEDIEEKALTSGDYPYDKKLKKDTYEEELQLLQVELVKMLDWLKKSGERIVTVFEGRDAAGKGGTIKRLTEHLNPRTARIVALSKPTEAERGQWYFQRYISQLPTSGEMAIYDRSWYNRGGVEAVFGFCTEDETKRFLAEAPGFEAMLRRDGKFVVKYFLSIGCDTQIKRLYDRWHDPLARWKLSDIDFAAIEKFHDYTKAYRRMLKATDTDEAPWTMIRANDKRRTRIETIRHFLNEIPYKGKDDALVKNIDRKIVMRASEFLERGGSP